MPFVRLFASPAGRCPTRAKLSVFKYARIASDQRPLLAIPSEPEMFPPINRAHATVACFCPPPGKLLRAGKKARTAVRSTGGPRAFCQEMSSARKRRKAAYATYKRRSRSWTCSLVAAADRHTDPIRNLRKPFKTKDREPARSAQFHLRIRAQLSHPRNL